MTTAVQPSELVFEFASNGMDEINQVRITPETPLFKLFFFFFKIKLSVVLVVIIQNWTPSFLYFFADQCLSIHHRHTVALCDPVDKC